MTPEEIREFERKEFEAESARLRQIAYAMVGQNRPQPVKVKAKPAPKPKPPRPPRIMPPLGQRPPGFNPCGEKLTAHGLSMTRSQWAKHLGVNVNTIRSRLEKMTPEQALVPGKLKTGRPKNPPKCLCETCPYRKDK